MKLSDETKAVLQDAPYLTLITSDKNGTPHPIIVGGKELMDENIVIGIYKMEKTQENLLENSKAWILAASVNNGPKGFRLCGTASVSGKKMIFVPDTVEAMI